MSEINVVAILTPAPGKASRLKELLAKMTEDVHSKEQSTLRYLMTEQVGSKEPSIFIIETYKSKEAIMEHANTPHYKAFFATLQKEALLSKNPYIARTVSFAGFELDRKLVGSKL